MNQEKIGKLIAKMRKQKDLTQRELGEMVGVGYRSVSKWERGLTMPDISIINELSTILGISSDELLNGELNPKDDKTEILSTDINPKPVKKNNKRLLFLLIISILIIVAIIGIIVIRNNNQKPTEYIMQSLHPEEYQVEGKLIIEGEKIIIKMNKIKFQKYNFSRTIINDCDYKIIINDKLLFGFGNESEYNEINKSINDFFEDFKIYYIEKTTLPKQDFESVNINIIFIIKDINNNLIEKKIEIKLLSNK